MLSSKFNVILQKKSVTNVFFNFLNSFFIFQLSYGLYSSTYDPGFGSSSGVYVSEKDLQDLGGSQGVEFRNMRSGEKEELKVN